MCPQIPGFGFVLFSFISKKIFIKLVKFADDKILADGCGQAGPASVGLSLVLRLSFDNKSRLQQTPEDMVLFLQGRTTPSSRLLSDRFFKARSCATVSSSCPVCVRSVRPPREARIRLLITHCFCGRKQARV